MHRESVLQAMGAARVLGYVSANGAHLLTRRIGRVAVPVWRNLPRDFQIRHAGFDGDAAIRDIDVEDSIESRQSDDDAAGDWHRAA